MINPYESTTAVPAADVNPDYLRARARWLGVTAIVCGFSFIPLAIIAFNLSMGPYYGKDAPRWFEYGQFLILLLPLAAEILGGAYFFVRRNVPKSSTQSASDNLIAWGTGTVVVLIATLILLIVSGTAFAICSQFTS